MVNFEVIKSQMASAEFGILVHAPSKKGFLDYWGKWDLSFFETLN
jgi:hypothetical protein